MIQSIERGTIVEMLVNSLEAERYVRRPLLQSIIDELGDDVRLASALVLARSLLERLDRVGDAEFLGTLRDIKTVLHDAGPRKGAFTYAPIAGAA